MWCFHCSSTLSRHKMQLYPVMGWDFSHVGTCVYPLQDVPRLPESCWPRCDCNHATATFVTSGCALSSHPGMVWEGPALNTALLSWKKLPWCPWSNLLLLFLHRGRKTKSPLSFKSSLIKLSEQAQPKTCNMSFHWCRAVTASSNQPDLKHIVFPTIIKQELLSAAR